MVTHEMDNDKALSTDEVDAFVGPAIERSGPRPRGISEH
jgi:hypothetical protein